MREIEFRGISITENKWIYGCLLDFKPEQKLFIQEWDFMLNPNEIKSNTLGQYTGFKDKNGIKIFEGDIVKDEYGRIMQICYKEYWGKFQFNLIKTNGDKWTNNFIWADFTDWFNEDSSHYPEIIGNIYDNPELIER